MDAIGKYTILEVIGRGGMGTVYRARDTVIGRDVAIKVIADHVASLPKVKERLYQEATSAGRLSHENIMTIFDVGEEDGAPYLVMELLDGKNLRSTLDSYETLTFERKIEIALQICRGLAYAHARGVVHRDIKPENISILSSGRLKIVDFGIARVESETRTMTHSSIGTPRYMSPEQVRGKEVDQRTDIFSFGVLLYELLSGVNPFDGSHVTAVIYKILHEEPEPIKLDDELLSADMQRVVAHCLEKNADKRYPDFPTVIRDLENILAKRQSDAATLFDDRRPLYMAEADPVVSNASGDGSGSGRWSRLSALWTPAGTENSTIGKADSSGDAPPISRAGWAKPAAAVVVVAFVVGGYFLLQAGSGRNGDTAAATSAANIDYAADELAELQSTALALRDEVLVEKANAEPFRESDALAKLYQAGLDSERVALEALQEETPSSYQRAIGALQMARNTFQAIAAGGSDDAAALRAQAENARQTMERAMRQVQAQKGSRLIADIFTRAESDVRKGDGQLEAGEYTAARISFGQAEAGFLDAKRVLDRAAAALELQRRSEIARNAMDEQRKRVAAWGDEASNAATYEQAERLRAEGFRLSEAGRYEEAREHFGRAEAAFAKVQEPAETTVSEGAATADQARTAMQQSRTRIPEQLRTGDDYANATQIEQRAQLAYTEGKFDESATLFQQAERRYSELAAVPPARSPEDAVRESLVPLLDRFKQGLQEEDGDELRRLHSFLGAYSAMFDVAEDIRADIDYADLNISGDRATVSISVAMSYKNKTQRMRPENQNVKLRWTLEALGNGTWQLRNVTPQ